MAQPRAFIGVLTGRKYWSSSFSISPSNEYSGPISFRIDWFDLLAVQGIWNSNTLAIWCKELTHWKRLWCWERLKVEGEGMTEDEMVGWHHQLDRCEFEQALGVGDGQGGLACCSSWGCKESDMTKWLNWQEGMSEVAYTCELSLGLGSSNNFRELVL